MILPVQLIAPTFPEGYCPPTLQQFANDLQSGTQISSPLNTDKIVVSDTAPADHSRLWFKTVGGAPISFPSIPIYFWHPTLADWVAAHGLLPGKHDWEIFASAADIDTWDTFGNNAAGPVTDKSGPFWMIEPLLNGRSPMSPGAITNANPAKSLGYSEAFGDGAVLQDGEAVGPHKHPLTADASIVDNDAIKVVTSGAGSAGLLIGATGPASTDLSVLNNTYTTTQQTMPVIHPVFGMSCIVRTARLYYVG